MSIWKVIGLTIITGIWPSILVNLTDIYGYQRQITPQVSAEAASAQPSLTENESEQEKRDKIIWSKLNSFKNRANDPYGVMLGILHIIIIIVCVVLMRNTAKVTIKSRFIQYFTRSYIVTGFFYVGEVIVPFFYATMANRLPQQSYAERYETVQTLLQVEYLWFTIDSMLSLFSTFWILAAWRLLWRYSLKRESIDKAFYTVLNAIFGAVVGPALIGVLLVQNINPLENAPRVPLLTVVDTLAAGTAIILFGLTLIQKLKPKEGHMVRWWPYFAYPFAALFSLWGAAQPLYIVFRGTPMSNPYFGLLLVMKLLCGLSVVILSSISLKERQRFET